MIPELSRATQRPISGANQMFSWRKAASRSVTFGIAKIDQVGVSKRFEATSRNRNRLPVMGMHGQLPNQRILVGSLVLRNDRAARPAGSQLRGPQRQWSFIGLHLAPVGVDQDHAPRLLDFARRRIRRSVVGPIFFQQTRTPGRIGARLLLRQLRPRLELDHRSDGSDRIDLRIDERAVQPFMLCVPPRLAHSGRADSCVDSDSSVRREPACQRANRERCAREEKVASG